MNEAERKRQECIEIEAKGVKVVVESPSWRMVALATIVAGSVLAGALLYIWEIGNV